MSLANTRKIFLMAVLVAGAVVAPAGAAPAPAAPDVTADLKYLPSDTSLLFIIRMDQLFTSDGFKKLLKEVPEIEKEGLGTFRKSFGFDMSNVATMTYGGHIKRQPIGVFHLKVAVSPDTVLKAMSDPRYPGDKGTVYKAEKIGSLTLQVPDEEYRQGFCFVNEKTLVVGQAKDLKPTLGREAKPEIGAGLQTALKMVDPMATVSMAMDTKAVFAAEKPPMIPGVDFAKIIDGVNGAALNIKIGSDVTVRGSADCKDAAAAEDVKKQAEAMRTFVIGMMQGAPKGQIPKELLELPAKVEFSTKGKQGIATLTMTADTTILLGKGMLIGTSSSPKVESKIETRPPERKP